MPAKNTYCPKCKSTNIEEVQPSEPKKNIYRKYRGLRCLEPNCEYRWTDERMQQKNGYQYRNY